MLKATAGFRFRRGLDALGPPRLITGVSFQMKTSIIVVSLLVVFAANSRAQVAASTEKAKRDYIGSIVYPVVNSVTGRTNAIALKIPRLQGNDVLKRECGFISDVSQPYKLTYKYLEKKQKTNSDYYIIALHDGDAKTLYDLLKHSEEFGEKSRLLVR